MSFQIEILLSYFVYVCRMSTIARIKVPLLYTKLNKYFSDVIYYHPGLVISNYLEADTYLSLRIRTGNWCRVLLCFMYLKPEHEHNTNWIRVREMKYDMT